MPVIEFILANSDIFLSSVAAPTSIKFSFIFFMYENLELNFIVKSVTPPSLIKVFEPAPKMFILSKI